MRDRTRLKLLAESNRAMGSMITWFTVFIIAFLLLVFTVKTINQTGAIIVITVISMSLGITMLYLLRYARLNGMMREDGRKPPAKEDADKLLEFNVVHAEPTIRLESREDNQIKLGRYEFSQKEWRRLHDALKDADWHWNRNNVASAGVIKSITASGVFPAFQKELIRLRVLDLDDRAITPGGRAVLRDAAGIRIVTP